MTTNLNTTAPRPRKRPAPSPRDQQIYLDYQAAGKRQIDLAEQYHLTQCRISQIVRRVEKWLHPVADVDRGNSDPTARQRLKRRLEYERLNEVCRQALRNFHEPQKSVTHKTGTRAGHPIDETTERLLPPNIQCLKVVLQASAQLSRLETKSPPEQDQPPDDSQRRAEVEAWLADQRDMAHSAGKVAGNYDPRFLVRALVSALIGDANCGQALEALAQDADKKVVPRKLYDRDRPQPPKIDGWYYPMHDGYGDLVAWLSADQVAGAISPDVSPVEGAASGAPLQSPLLEPGVLVSGCGRPTPKKPS